MHELRRKMRRKRVDNGYQVKTEGCFLCLSLSVPPHFLPSGKTMIILIVKDEEEEEAAAVLLIVYV